MESKEHSKSATLATLDAALKKHHTLVSRVQATAKAIDAAISEVHANAAVAREKVATLEAEARIKDGADQEEISRQAADLLSQIDAAESRKVSLLEAEAVVADNALEQAAKVGEAAQAAADAARADLTPGTAGAAAATA